MFSELAWGSGLGRGFWKPGAVSPGWQETEAGAGERGRVAGYRVFVPHSEI